MAISIRRLAQLAGASHVTVSRALRGLDGVSAENRRKLVALARKYNYPVPVTKAREMADLCRVVCALIDVGQDEARSGQGFNLRLLAGARKGAADCGAELMTGPSGEGSWPLVILRQQVDGAILTMGNELDPHPALPAPVPLVFIFNGPPGSDVVATEDFRGSKILGMHLAAIGHRRVAYLGPLTDMSLERLHGLRAGLESAGGVVPPEYIQVFRQMGTREHAGLLIDNLLQAVPPGGSGPNGPAATEFRPGEVGFTALMCYNDYFAAAAIMHLRERGVRVPEDLSVVGFDNVRPDWYDGPALTTMDMPLENIGAEAARFIYWRLAHPEAPPRRLVMSVSLIEGVTAAAPCAEPLRRRAGSR